jgi:hypothetical protein
MRLIILDQLFQQRGLGHLGHDEPSLQVSLLFPLVVSRPVLQGFTPTISC